MKNCLFPIIKRRLGRLLVSSSGTVMYEYVLMCLNLFVFLLIWDAAATVANYWVEKEQNDYGMLLLGFGGKLQEHYGGIADSIAEQEPGNTD